MRSSIASCSTGAARSACDWRPATRSPRATIFVSAGAIHSPAILLRSGVGVGDGLAVGANLKDHAATPGFELALREPGRAPERRRRPVFSSMLRYTSGLADAGPERHADHLVQRRRPDRGGARRRPSDRRGHARVLAGRGAAALGRSARRPDRRVPHAVRRARPRAAPRLRAADASTIVRHPAVAAIADGVLGARRRRSTSSTPTTRSTPGSPPTSPTTSTPSGRAAWDAPTIPAAVVDTDCRVIGYDGLRVCDASVMPDLPKANTHLTTVAIAERLVAKLRV